MPRPVNPCIATAVILVLCLVLVVLAYAAGVEVGRADRCGPAALTSPVAGAPGGTVPPV
jgi:hypothetical protein